MQGWKLVIGLGALVSVGAGCKKAANEAIAAAGEQLDSDTPSAEEEATSAFVAGFNTLVSKAVPCASEYDDQIPESGPEAGKKYHFFPTCKNAESIVPTLTQSFAQARARAPGSLKAMADHADATLVAFRSLLSTSADVVRYYDSAQNVADNGVRGATMHTQIRGNIADFRAKMGAFEADLSAKEDATARADLAKFEADKGYGYWFRKASLDAAQLLKAKPDDARAFASAAAAMHQAEIPFNAFVQEKGATINVTFKGFADAYNRFDSNAQRFVQSASTQAKPERLANEYQQLVQGYNTMVTLANSLREVEAAGVLN